MRVCDALSHERGDCPASQNRVAVAALAPPPPTKVAGLLRTTTCPTPVSTPPLRERLRKSELRLRRPAVRICDAAVLVLRELDCPAVMWGDCRLLDDIAERAGIERKPGRWLAGIPDRHTRILNALSRQPGILVPRYVVLGNGRPVRNRPRPGAGLVQPVHRVLHCEGREAKPRPRAPCWDGSVCLLWSPRHPDRASTCAMVPTRPACVEGSTAAAGPTVSTRMVVLDNEVDTTDGREGARPTKAGWFGRDDLHKLED